MILIGEKINGTRKGVQTAILNRDADAIRALVIEQIGAGADYVDVNAGTGPDREMDDMIWLLDLVQETAPDAAICIDSSSADTLAAAMEHVHKTPLVNSINADPRRLKSFIPLIQAKNCPVIALALDESRSGMPKSNAERLENLARVFEATRGADIPDDHIFVDPLIMSVATDIKAGAEVLDCIRQIHETYPQAHITGGLSNISFGLPERALVNRTFLTMAMQVGLDSAVCNPANRALIESIKATDMLLGRDRFCRKYTVAAKNGFTRN